MSRQEILADFQACTGIDDVAVCLEHLEKTDWNLLTAIHRAIPEHSQTLPSERSAPNHNNHINPYNMSRNNSATNHFALADSETRDNALPDDQAVQIVPNSGSSSSSVDTATRVIDMTEASDFSDVEDLTESYHDDDFLVPETNSSRKEQKQRFLISDNVGDESTGAILFYESFVGRYGHCHPMFFQDSLDAAVREATQRPAKDRRLLALYLHHDGSVLSNIFCQQVLCAEAVVNLISNSFIVWGWDCTHESNRQLLLTSVSRSFGPQAVATIRNFDRDRYPVIIVLSRSRSTTEICSIIPGATGVDEVLSNLLHSVEQFRAQQVLDIREEEEREARDRVIQEQNYAYQESLRADMAKEEAKKALELQKRRDEDEKVAVEARADALRKKVAASLPPEPDAGCKEGICALRCRLPNGRIASRKFLQSSPLSVLYDFLFSEGFGKDQYKILFSYPKRDLTEVHSEYEPFGKVFNAQDTLILEGR